ncbi:MAG TPA: hypothetical protein PKZ53_28435, partial [Acidobacteriota bacterium]|nr:hypothetical protein [Acidobacteriota bacterium]
EREWVCDEAVLCGSVTAQTYAASLWKVAQFSLGWPQTKVAGVARVSGSNLKRRIEAMLQNEFPKRLAWPQRFWLGLTVAALVMVAGVLALPPQTPAFAQIALLDADKVNLAEAAQPGIPNQPESKRKLGMKREMTEEKTGVAVSPAASLEPQAAANASQTKLPDNLDQWPEYSVLPVNPAGAPLLVTRASIHALPKPPGLPSLGARLGQAEHDEWWSYVNFTLNNTTAKGIARMVFTLENPAFEETRVRHVLTFGDRNSVLIEPLDNYATRKGIDNRPVTQFQIKKTSPFNPAAFSLRLTLVEFTDGSSWQLAWDANQTALQTSLQQLKSSSQELSVSQSTSQEDEPL